MSAPQENKLFKMFLGVSLGAHILAYSLSWAVWPHAPAVLEEEREFETELYTEFDGGALGSKTTLPRSEESQKAELIQNTLPQLPKTFKLPDEGGEEDENPDEIANKKPEPPKTDEPKPQKGVENKLTTINPQKDDAQKITPEEALRREAINKLKEKAKAETKKNQAPKEQKVAEVGDEKGDSQADEARESRKQNFLKARTGQYKKLLKASVRYVLPNTYERLGGKLKIEVKLVLHAKGHIQNLELYQESGDSNFDRIILTAIRDAAPFKPPPEHLIGKSFILEFNH